MITSPFVDRLALSTGSGALEPAFEFAAANGISWLEFACQEPANQPHTFDAERISGVRTLMDKYGISGVLHSASSVNVAEIVPSVRDAVDGHVLDYLNLAHQLNCETVIVHAGFHFGLDHTERFAALRLTLENAARTAEKLGLKLVLENMNVLPVEAEIRYLGCTFDEVAEILDAIDSPTLTSCVDIGHAHLLPEGAVDFISRLDGRIGHVQLTDNGGVFDDHLAIGDGTLPMAEIITALDAAGYGGPIAIELSDRDAQLRSLASIRAGVAAPA